MLHPHDQIFQQTCPTIMVPRFSEIEPLERSGHRFLAASDGLWMEVRRPWLHLIWPVALQSVIAMPYGTLEPTIKFAFDSLPQDLLQQFKEDARQLLPNEAGAWITWDSQTLRFSYRPLMATSAGSAHLELDRPVLGEFEHLVVDIHSHARIPAFFSPEDNTDDAGEVKLSVVAGQLGADQQPSSKMRLCAHGLTIPMGEIKKYASFHQEYR